MEMLSVQILYSDSNFGLSSDSQCEQKYCLQSTLLQLYIPLLQEENICVLEECECDNKIFEYTSDSEHLHFGVDLYSISCTQNRDSR